MYEISLTQLTRDGNAAVVSAANAALEKIAQRVNRFAFVDQLFFGLSLGSVLLLASIGLAITFGVMGVINMAHGEMIMLGAYTTYVVQLIMPNYIDYSIWVAIPAAFLVSGLMGVLIERLVILPLAWSSVRNFAGDLWYQSDFAAVGTDDFLTA